MLSFILWHVEWIFQRFIFLSIRKRVVRAKMFLRCEYEKHLSDGEL